MSGQHKSSILDGVSNASSARTALELGSAATAATTDFDAAGAAAGVQSNLLTLQSSSTSQWNINPSSTRAVSYVSVSYSNNTNATAIAATNSTDGGNNTNWSF